MPNGDAILRDTTSTRSRPRTSQARWAAIAVAAVAAGTAGSGCGGGDAKRVPVVSPPADPRLELNVTHEGRRLETVTGGYCILRDSGTICADGTSQRPSTTPSDLQGGDTVVVESRPAGRVRAWASTASSRMPAAVAGGPSAWTIEIPLAAPRGVLLTITVDYDRWSYATFYAPVGAT